MYSPDDDYYWLKHDIYGTYTDVGTLFCTGEIDFAKPTKNIVIFGHHFTGNDWLMFGSLLNYRNQSYCDAHPTFIFDTLYGMYEYRVFAAFNCTVSNNYEYNKQHFVSDEAFLEFVEGMRSRSFYDTGVTVNADDSILTLSTCDRSYDWEEGRFVVMLVRVGEYISE